MYTPSKYHVDKTHAYWNKFLWILVKTSLTNKRRHLWKYSCAKAASGAGHEWTRRGRCWSSRHVAGPEWTSGRRCWAPIWCRNLVGLKMAWRGAVGPPIWCRTWVGLRGRCWAPHWSSRLVEKFIICYILAPRLHPKLSAIHDPHLGLYT